MKSAEQRRRWLLWLARLVVGVVFFFNVTCALSFVAWPDRYAPSFEVSGVPGRVLVRGIGLLFLMWNATYPPVLARPDRHRTLFAVLLVQQAIGLAGETWMWLTLPAGHAALWTTGLRFIAFDGAGLAGMGMVFWLLYALKRTERTSPSCTT
ncbi:MAG TPA: hypothetical protein VMY80_14250 [Anaerolineae bacterium]|nr:hypothetical protein [Anaerolineae bacterium]